MLNNTQTGFYTVGQQIFTSKLKACIEGTRLGVHPKWNFHQDVWQGLDWTSDPEESLEELYKKRALEIRQRYDYVVLVWSGGADSTNMLHAFLKNNIPVDEIITQWAIRGSDRYRNPELDRSAENCVAEWEYCVKPQIKKIQKSNPEIKFTVIDTTEDLVRCEYLESDFFLFNNYHNIAGMNRWPPFIRAMEKIGEKKKNHVFLVGLDKPRFHIRQNKLYMYFIDVVTHLQSTQSMNIEYFYWSPRSANILKKQAHIVKRFCTSHPNSKETVSNGKIHNYDLRNAVINALIYPWWDPKIFQSAKQDFLLYNNQQKWIWYLDQYKDGYRKDRWESQYRNLLSLVDKKFYEYRKGVFDGLIGFVTDDYFIGAIHA